MTITAVMSGCQSCGTSAYSCTNETPSLVKDCCPWCSHRPMTSLEVRLDEAFDRVAERHGSRHRWCALPPHGRQSVVVMWTAITTGERDEATLASLAERVFRTWAGSRSGAQWSQGAWNGQAVAVTDLALELIRVRQAIEARQVRA